MTRESCGINLPRGKAKSHCQAARNVVFPIRAQVGELLFSSSFFFLLLFTTLGETFVAPHGSRTAELGSIIVNLEFILILGTFLILADSRLESRE